MASLSPLEGERTQITVLFAKLKGSMEVLPDPEEARQLLNLMLECMMAAVHRYEGTVNQVMGDGIMVLSRLGAWRTDCGLWRLPGHYRAQAG
jgi:class 3 adenylate cyclase